MAALHRWPATHRRALPPGGAALLGAALFGAALFGAVPIPALAEINCFAATDAMTAGRWAEAIPILEARIADPACASQTGSLRYSLAYATEKLAHTEPARACAAADHYAAVVVEDAAITTAATAGRARMDAACRHVRAAEASLDGNASTEVTPAVDRTAAIGLTIGASLAAVAGGTLLYFGVQADGERQDAEGAMRTAHGAGDEGRLDRAESDFTDAADRATAFGLSGWGALAVAAGLGVAATWAWVDDGPVLTVGAGQVGVGGRF